MLLRGGALAAVECAPSGQSAGFGRAGVEASAGLLAVGVVAQQSGDETAFGAGGVVNVVTAEIVIEMAELAQSVVEPIGDGCSDLAAAPRECGGGRSGGPLGKDRCERARSPLEFAVAEGLWRGVRVEGVGGVGWSVVSMVGVVGRSIRTAGVRSRSGRS
ncbi:hypothetical protein [Streptomyces sp. NBC_00690]|uniref:hypothetical protein n=1 Tax=Streptomyces sp. NBC_00690 TaxID=2975808 RepID=UPI002E2D8514|nr:hypothetical protein [Streptomyces sp. NBC_00690]